MVSGLIGLNFIFQGVIEKMRNNGLTLIIVLISIMLLSTTAYGARAATIEVVPHHTDAHTGEVFTVDIFVDPEGKEVYGVQYLLSFDKSAVRADVQAKGLFLTSDGNESAIVVGTINNTTGICEYSETRKNTTVGIASCGTLTTVTFTAIGDPGASSYLNLSEVIITDVNFSTIDCEVTNGTLAVHHESLVADALVYDEYNNVGSKYLCKVCFDGSGSHAPEGSSITSYEWSFGDGTYGTDMICEHIYASWNWNGPDEPGNYYEPFHALLTVTDDEPATNTTYFDVIVHIAGDANGDGVVNIIDATIVGFGWGRSCSPPDTCWRDLPDEWADRADLNNDHVVNILDIVIIGIRWKDTAWR